MANRTRLASLILRDRRLAGLPGVSSARRLSLADGTRGGEAEGSGRPRVLITGGLGQLGMGLAREMRKRYGKENIILSDVQKPSAKVLEEGPYKYVNVLDMKHLHSVVVNNNIDWVVHLAAVLSAIGEKNVAKALEVNVQGFDNIAELCKAHGLRLFSPSTIGAFGPSSPRHSCPDLTVMRPRTVYGVSKVYMELLGEYYHHKYGLDFRCLRFPGVLSVESDPGGGTTDYAIHIFHEVAKRNYYKCFLKEDTRLPMIYQPDCIKATVLFLEAPSSKLSKDMRTYNIQGVSFTPAELVQEMRRFFPKMEVDYEPDHRQEIAKTWPEELDDECARVDWGWSHGYDLPGMVQDMAVKISKRYASPGSPQS